MLNLIIFDLDKTLAESKSNIYEEMSVLLKQLSRKYAYISIISGGDYPQFEKQVLPFINLDFSKLILCPTSGTKMYLFKNKEWELIYSDTLEEKAKETIISSIDIALDKLGLRPQKTWGPIIEDRGTQITASILGQQAPVDEKEKWDTENIKKKQLQSYLQPILSNFEVNFGGSTSIDVLKKGVDKSYGVKKIMDIFSFKKEEILFIGDRIYPGGNDYPIFQMGIESIQTIGPENTK